MLAGGKNRRRAERWLIIGQSNARRLRDQTLLEGTGDQLRPHPLTFTFKDSWGPNYADGAINLANRLASATGRQIRIINAARGGAALLAASAQAPGYWLDFGTADSPYDSMLTMLDQAGGRQVTGIIWFQGIRDSQTAGTLQADYLAGLQSLVDQLRADLVNQSGRPEIPFYTAPHELNDNGAVTDTEHDNVTRAQLDFPNTRAGVYLALDSWDITSLPVDMHFDEAGNNEFGKRWALGILAERRGLSDRGPAAIRAEWAAGTPAAIDVLLSHNNGNDIVAGNYTGFVVDDGGAPVAVTAAARAGPAKITLTLAAPLAGTAGVTLGYMNGHNPDVSVKVYDNAPDARPLRQIFDMPLDAL